MQKFNLSVNVLEQNREFLGLPTVPEVLDQSDYECDLVRGQFFVLAQVIRADHVTSLNEVGMNLSLLPLLRLLLCNSEIDLLRLSCSLLYLCLVSVLVAEFGQLFIELLAILCEFFQFLMLFLCEFIVLLQLLFPLLQHFVEDVLPEVGLAH